MPIRFLTKSRFKVGFECPTKLFFLDDPAYGNTNIDNSFLEALAEGGQQRFDGQFCLLPVEIELPREQIHGLAVIGAVQHVEKTRHRDLPRASLPGG